MFNIYIYHWSNCRRSKCRTIVQECFLCIGMFTVLSCSRGLTRYTEHGWAFIRRSTTAPGPTPMGARPLTSTGRLTSRVTHTTMKTAPTSFATLMKPTRATGGTTGFALIPFLTCARWWLTLPKPEIWALVNSRKMLAYHYP